MAIALDQTIALNTSAAPSGSTIMSFGTGPTSGSTVLVYISGYDGAGYAVSTVADNQSNSYSRVAQSTLAYSNTCRIELWAAYNVTSSGTFTITVSHPTSDSYVVCGASSFTGLIASSAALDSPTVTLAAADNTATDANITAAAAGTQASELVIALAVACRQGDTDVNWGTAATTGYSNLGKYANFSAITTISADYKILSASETSVANWAHDDTNTAGIDGWRAIIASFKDALTGPSPSTGSILLTTYAPTADIVTGPISIPIGVGTQTFTTNGLSADVAGSGSIIPTGVGSTLFSQYAPGLGIALGVPNAGDNPETFPDDGNMGITGYDVFLDFDYNISIEVGSATLTGYDLSADSGQGTFIPVDVGSITTTGYAPEDFNSHVPSPDVGIQTITGYVPLIGTSHTRTPDTVEITITGYDVSTAPTSDIYIDISSGSITSASSSPSLIRGTGRAPDTATLGITGYTPDAISEDVSWEFFPDTGSATYSTYDLTLSIIEVHKSIPIAVGSLVIPGWKLPFGTEPSVEVGARKRRKILGFLK